MEKVIVDLDLGAGLKIIWQQHHRGRHLAELIDLISQNKNREWVSRGVENYSYTVSGQESEKGNWARVRKGQLKPHSFKKTLLMHSLDRGERDGLWALLLPNKDYSKQPSHRAPHTPAPEELHAHNSHFISGKPCRQLRTIFKAWEILEEKKNYPQQTQDKQFHAPLKTKGILKVHKRVNGTLRGQQQQEQRCPYPARGISLQRGPVLPDHSDRVLCSRSHLPRCKVKEEQLI